MIEFRIKEKTKSLNQSFRGDWRPRAAVAKRQRTKAMQVCPKWPGGPLLCVRLTRVSPGTLDSDALPAALKHVRDGVADRLKIDDASPLVEWLYHQEKGQAEAVVQIWNPNLSAPPLPPLGQPMERGTSLRKASTVKGGLKHSSNVGAKCGKNGCREQQPCANHDGTMKGLAIGMVESAYTPPRASRTNHMATKAMEPSNSAEHRALLAAREAEETFAPAEPAGSICQCGTCAFCIAGQR